MRRPRLSEVMLAVAALCAVGSCARRQAVGLEDRFTEREVPFATSAPDAGVSGSERLEWASHIVAPQPDRAAVSEVEARLSEACGEHDASLHRLARRLARRQAQRMAALTMDEIVIVLRSEGAPYVRPRVWSVEADRLDPREARARLDRWLRSFETAGVRRCGVGWQAEDGMQAVAAVVVDAHANLAPVPTRVRPGTWIALRAQMLVDADGAELVVLGPIGRPHALPATLSAGTFRAGFSADRPGQWLVQVLAEVAGGPQPVLEATLHVGIDPPLIPAPATAPGERDAGGNPASALYEMINQARKSERLGQLGRLPDLELVAQRHAEAMRSARRLAHDLGRGDPKQRVLESNARVREAGENVAHAASIRRAHRIIWASPSHRANLLEARYDVIGVGVAEDDDGSVWVCELFARRER